MTTSPVPDHAHPVRRSVARLSTVLDDTLSVPLWSLTAGDTGDALREVLAAKAKLEALELALVAHGDSDAVDLPAHEATTSMISWLRRHAGLAPRHGKNLVRLAHGVEQHPLTRQAIGSGTLPVAKAAVIVAAVDALPDDLPPSVREEGERHLLDEAPRFDTAQLRRLGERLQAVLDPDGADERDAEHLARLEAEAARTCFLRLRHDEASGVTDITARVPLLEGLKLARQLEALLSPRRPDPIDLTDEHGIRIAAAERRGLALVELIERMPAAALPTTGGCDPVIVATMELETLLGGLKPVLLDTGHRISPGLARRLAARHGVIPAVLGTKSEVLDLGRKARLASKKQRLAMSVQQGGICAEEHCDVPITWADAHHLVPWRNGGRTDLNDLVMPCKKHHRMADHPDYQVTRLGPGRIRITRRART